jgi:hypothetical protein
MLEAKIPGLRLTGYNGENAANTVAKGMFMYKDGPVVAADIPLGTIGNSSLGDSPKMKIANEFTHSGYGVFPVDKIILQTQDADQDLDTIASGARLRYYVGGQYETDEYDATVSGVGAAAGDLLWINDSGQISLAASTDGPDVASDTPWNLPAIGEIVRISDFPATTAWFNWGNASNGVHSYRKTVWFELYPNHQHAAFREV